MAALLVDGSNYTIQQIKQMNYLDYVEEVIQAIQKQTLILSKQQK